MRAVRFIIVAVIALLALSGAPSVAHRDVSAPPRAFDAASDHGGMAPDGSGDAVVRAAAGVAVVPTPSHPRTGTIEALAATGPLVAVPSHVRFESSRFPFARPFDPPPSPPLRTPDLIVARWIHSGST